ncbi:permease-like cell division protein FtsX [Ferruginibacter sp. SUN106]|uniref:permease-like cell division protein FtsX n=1 Tax=Ferruginibacter sp. SUN106 TaxID=2978348 RepID=UPI003D36ABE8
MQKICLVVFICWLYSCHTKNSIDSSKWQMLDSFRGLSYSITETGKGEKGDISIKYFGWKKDDKVISDTAAERQFIVEQLITPALMANEKIKQLPKGTTGYISINTSDFFQQNYTDIRHYTLFFSGVVADKTLKEDSLKLESMNVFKRIEIINSAKALDKFTEDNDTTWKSFIKSNPLPASIELTLKKEFLTKEKYDSIKNILSELLPVSEIQLPYVNGLLDAENGIIKQELVYKFVIF